MMAQCVLKREIPNGHVVTVAWVEDKNLKIGSSVKLRDDSEWWTVDWISETRFPNDYVNEKSRDHKRTRKTSDI